MTRSLGFLIFLSLLQIGCSSLRGPYYAKGKIADQYIAENMDSEIAKSALLSEDNNYTDPTITQLFQKFEINGTPTPHQLEALVEQGSTDFASIIYARSLLNENNNLFWQNESRQLSTQLNSNALNARIKQNFSEYHALLIPGWHWETRRDTGADLEFQKKTLASYGLTSSLVKTQEHGSVETNGEIIAKAIQAASSLNKSIIIISVSKGGADTAYALGKALDFNNASHLVGWLNIGGIIAGSTLVDLEFNDPEKWLTSIGFSPDTPLTAVESLQKDVAIQRMSQLDYPQNVTIVNYVAVPFTSNLTKRSRYSFNRLASYGPNDGAALTYEMLVPNKHTVLEIGIDHFMRSLRVMNRAIALLYLITEDNK